jgi:uncharacterized membrane protein YhaH (DUF805 family)
MFKAPFSFNGRIRRSEFGISFIIYAICYLILKGIMEFGSNGDGILGLAFVPIIWFIWAQAAKRCHDLGKNGFWFLIPFYVFWLLFQDSEVGFNDYGASPKAYSGMLPSLNESHEVPEISNDKVIYHDGHIDLTKK